MKLECYGCKKMLPATTEYYTINGALKRGFSLRCNKCSTTQRIREQSLEYVPVVQAGETGLDLDDLSIKLGQVFKINNQKNQNVFTGKVIDITNDLVLMISRYGVKTCFQKIDFLLDDYIIQEVVK